MALYAATVTQVCGTAVAFFGESLVDYIGLQRTPLIRSVLENRLQLLGVSFLFNSIAQSLAKTDAFEVFVNGELVFSKLEKKRMPTLDEIFEALGERGIQVPTELMTKQAVRSRQM